MKYYFYVNSKLENCSCKEWVKNCKEHCWDLFTSNWNTPSWSCYSILYF